MKNREIYILGVGHNTSVYIDLLEVCGYIVKGLYHYKDGRVGEMVFGIPIIDSNTNLFHKSDLIGFQFAISVGDNIIRRNLSEQIRKKGGFIPTLIHPSAIVSKYASLDKSVVVHANAVVQAGVTIMEDSVISFNVSVTHHSTIGKACYIAAGSNVGAYVTINDRVLIGQSSVIVSGKVEFIGKNAIIGAGSVITRNINEHEIVAGNPAKALFKSSAL